MIGLHFNCRAITHLSILGHVSLLVYCFTDNGSHFRNTGNVLICVKQTHLVYFELQFGRFSHPAFWVQFLKYLRIPLQVERAVESYMTLVWYIIIIIYLFVQTISYSFNILLIYLEAWYALWHVYFISALFIYTCLSKKSPIVSTSGRYCLSYDCFIQKKSDRKFN